MSYVKNTWQTGDTITATGLNHMEDGIADAGGGGAFIVTATNDQSTQTVTMDKTWKEIKEAMLAGASCWCKDESTYENLWVAFTTIWVDSGIYRVGTRSNSYEEYSTDNENGYPSYYYGD